MRRSMTDGLCRCGHPYDSHEHLRNGTDCAWCEPGVCNRFVRPSLLQRLCGRVRPSNSGTGRPGPTLVLVR
jgi:hypothetical protein